MFSMNHGKDHMIPHVFFVVNVPFEIEIKQINTCILQVISILTYGAWFWSVEIIWYLELNNTTLMRKTQWLMNIQVINFPMGCNKILYIVAKNITYNYLFIFSFFLSNNKIINERKHIKQSWNISNPTEITIIVHNLKTFIDIYSYA